MSPHHHCCRLSASISSAECLIINRLFSSCNMFFLLLSITVRRRSGSHLYILADGTLLRCASEHLQKWDIEALHSAYQLSKRFTEGDRIIHGSGVEHLHKNFESTSVSSHCRLNYSGLFVFSFVLYQIDQVHWSELQMYLMSSKVDVKYTRVNWSKDITIGG